EAVLITGGTCTSEATSGTITFTPANNHSGTWTLKSASAGIKEANIYQNALIKAANLAKGLPCTSGTGCESGASIYVPPGNHFIYGPLIFNRDEELAGAGPQVTRLYFQYTSGDYIQFKNDSTATGVNFDGGTFTTVNAHGFTVYGAYA